mmetsp:Transcript_106432/g.307982  ORF Transcript_106432/g.307982 Transcript_106432/m.307982 type:complete len:271 (-) Transcript_106432:8-820(-)
MVQLSSGCRARRGRTRCGSIGGVEFRLAGLDCHGVSAARPQLAVARALRQLVAGERPLSRRSRRDHGRDGHRRRQRGRRAPARHAFPGLGCDPGLCAVCGRCSARLVDQRRRPRRRLPADEGHGPHVCHRGALRSVHSWCGGPRMARKAQGQPDGQRCLVGGHLRGGLGASASSSWAGHHRGRLHGLGLDRFLDGHPWHDAAVGYDDDVRAHRQRVLHGHVGVVEGLRWSVARPGLRPRCRELARLRGFGLVALHRHGRRRVDRVSRAPQ